MSSGQIQYLQHSDIDKQKWDSTVEQASNRLIYAYSFYLDGMSPGWHALVGDNYEWILPLTWKKKYGISYLYQPAFMQQLGVFFKAGVQVPYDKIITTLQQQFIFCEAQWNYTTPILSGVQTQPGTNYTLDLSAEYSSLSKRFSSDLQRNIRRSLKFDQAYTTTQDYKLCIQAYRQYYGSRFPHVTPQHYQQFEAVCEYAATHKMLRCRTVTGPGDQLLACVLLLFDGKRLYNIMNTTTNDGRKKEANYFLFHYLLQEFSAQQIIFDFEGSDLPGVKSFYEKFGAIDQPYCCLRYNKLPALLRWLKR